MTGPPAPECPAGEKLAADAASGQVNPVVYRPLFEHLQLVTCRTFETPAAGTIPLFVREPEYVREIYGARAVELVLGGDPPHAKILDVNTAAAPRTVAMGGWNDELAECAHISRLDTSTAGRVVQEPFSGTVTLNGYGIAAVSTQPCEVE